jgi:phosphoribosylformylglycinamidine cyclo-ligase
VPEDPKARVEGESSSGTAGEPTPRGLTYSAAGVNIDAGEEAVRLIRPQVESTYIPGVLGSLGGFAAMYEMPSHLKDPVLVTATDGVGTKLLVAQELGRLTTVGIDLVAMSVNDVLTLGARPLLFLDYIATGRLVPAEIADIVKGVADGCRQAGCALVGGEMAEMPGLYQGSDFDLAGFCVAVAEKGRLVDGSAVAEGDTVLGLASSGLHSNGFSLARRILEDNQCRLGDKFPRLGETIGQTLLEPTRIYVRSVFNLLDMGLPLHGMAHVTGGGIGGNLSRVIPAGLTAELDFREWRVPAVFRMLQELGQVEEAEMFRTFNMGVGMVLVLPDEVTDYVMKLLRRAGEEPLVLGTVVASARDGERRVSLEGVF